MAVSSIIQWHVEDHLKAAIGFSMGVLYIQLIKWDDASIASWWKRRTSPRENPQIVRSHPVKQQTKIALLNGINHLLMKLDHCGLLSKSKRVIAHQPDPDPHSLHPHQLDPHSLHPHQLDPHSLRPHQLDPRRLYSLCLHLLRLLPNIVMVDLKQQTSPKGEIQALLIWPG